MPTNNTHQLEEGDALNLDWQKLQKITTGSQQQVLPVVVQDAASKEVLILAYVNEQALQQTLTSKQVTFYSTSRNELWVKGATSGDYLTLVEARVNCEQNSLLFLVNMATGNSCHTKNKHGHHRKSCYYRQIHPPKKLEHLDV